MNVALLAGLVLTQQTAPLPQTPVSLTHTGALIGDVLPKLGEAAGVTLELGDDMHRHFLTLHLTDAPLSAVMAEIADVTVGRWVQSAEGWRLLQDKQRLDKVEADSKAEKLKEIRKGKEAVLDVTDPRRLLAEIPEERREEFSYYFTRSAEEQLILDLLYRIPDKTYLDLTEGQRLVFSTSPTRMQSPLNLGNSSRLIDQWVTEHNAMVSESGSDMGEEAMPDFMMEMWEKMGYIPKRIEGTPSKALLILTGNDYGSAYATLGIYDNQGNMVLSTAGSLDSYSGIREYVQNMLKREPGSEEEYYDDSDKEYERKRAAMPREDHDDTPIEYSDTRKLVQKGLAGVYGGSVNTAVSPEVKAILVRPDLNDPVALASGERLVFAAKTKGINLVANLVDWEAGLSYSYGAEGQPETIRKLREEFELDEYTYVSTKKSGWWSLRPKNIKSVIDGRVDRRALATLIEKSDGRIVSNLEAMADYAAYNPPLDESSLSSDIGAVVPGITMMGGMLSSRGMDWQTLRLYGRLTAGQRTALKAGNPIQGASLSKDAQETLAEMLYSNPVRLKMYDPREQQASSIEDMVMNIYGGGGWEGGYGMGARTLFGEPTEVAPTGLPRNLIIQSSVKDENYVVQVDQNKQPTTQSYPFSTEEAVIFRSLFRTPETMAMPEYQMNTLVTGKRKNIDVTVLIAPRSAIRFALFDYEVPTTDAFYTIDSLPSGMESEAKRFEEQLRASAWYRYYQEMMSGDGYGGGGRIKP